MENKILCMNVEFVFEMAVIVTCANELHEPLRQTYLTFLMTVPRVSEDRKIFVRNELKFSTNSKH